MPFVPERLRHAGNRPWPNGPPAGGVSGLDLSGLELPPFDGPLVAFDPAPGGAPGGPVYLGGDLHRVHPDTSEPCLRRLRDPSLEEAMVCLSDREHEILEATAVAGVWCLALHDDLVDSAPYFALWDMKGRMRAWLLLPPARLMIGIGHFWLPSVPPPRRPPGVSDETKRAR
jgi:hypothetical protein